MSSSRLQISIDQELEEQVNGKLFDIELSKEQIIEQDIIKHAMRLDPNPVTVTGEEFAAWYDRDYGDY